MGENQGVDQPESGLGVSIEVDEKLDDHFEVVTEEDVKEATEEMANNEKAIDTTVTEQRHILVIGHDVHLTFNEAEKNEKSKSDEAAPQIDEVTTNEQVPDETTEQVDEDKLDVKEDAKEENEEVVEEEQKEVDQEVIKDVKETEVQESTVAEEVPQQVTSVPDAVQENPAEIAEHEASKETVAESETKQTTAEITTPEDQAHAVRTSSLTESEVAKAVIAQALESRDYDEEDNKPAPRPVKDHTVKIDIVK